MRANEVLDERLCSAGVRDELHAVLHPRDELERLVGLRRRLEERPGVVGEAVVVLGCDVEDRHPQAPRRGLGVDPTVVGRAGETDHAVDVYEENRRFAAVLLQTINA